MAERAEQMLQRTKREFDTTLESVRSHLDEERARRQQVQHELDTLREQTDAAHADAAAIRSVEGAQADERLSEASDPGALLARVIAAETRAAAADARAGELALLERAASQRAARSETEADMHRERCAELSAQLSGVRQSAQLAEGHWQQTNDGCGMNMDERVAQVRDERMERQQVQQELDALRAQTGSTASHPSAVDNAREFLTDISSGIDELDSRLKEERAKRQEVQQELGAAREHAGQAERALRERTANLDARAEELVALERAA
eukprot:gene17104-15832_t